MVGIYNLPEAAIYATSSSFNMNSVDASEEPAAGVRQ